ncbi:hypothetical protein GCM10018785_33300 [Streptomyces longispororuber]|uniref:DUF7848 domain-containing protein n=2 Tax=Streptomyces longispororuber TaxID=68230 RepID=A0A918ZPP8_9ACTN|nr:hypothetical protein GCM10018785_33300 [Streptomyces longispororuber]
MTLSTLRYTKHRIMQHPDTELTFEARCLTCTWEAEPSLDGATVDVECMSHTGRTQQELDAGTYLDDRLGKQPVTAVWEQWTNQMRHYYGSRLLYAGVPENDVADWMGHSGTDVLREHYHYIFEEAEQRSRAAIATMLAPGADDPTERSEVA